MKIILTTNIKKLGKVGDLVNVKDGYARNFLLPKKMALRENKKNLDYYEGIKEEIKIKENNKLELAKKTIEDIKKLKIHFNKEADEKGQEEDRLRATFEDVGLELPICSQQRCVRPRTRHYARAHSDIAHMEAA